MDFVNFEPIPPLCPSFTPIRFARYRPTNRYDDFGEVVRSFCWIWKDCQPEFVYKHWEWYRQALQILWQDRPIRAERVAAIFRLLKEHRVFSDSSLAFEAAEHMVKIHSIFYWKIRDNRNYSRRGFKLLISVLLDLRFWLSRSFARILCTELIKKSLRLNESSNFRHFPFWCFHVEGQYKA